MTFAFLPSCCLCSLVFFPPSRTFVLPAFLKHGLPGPGCVSARSCLAKASPFSPGTDNSSKRFQILFISSSPHSLSQHHRQLCFQSLRNMKSIFHLLSFPFRGRNNRILLLCTPHLCHWQIYSCPVSWQLLQLQH